MEEGLSPQTRALLLVGSRQLLHQAVVFLDESSPELSDVRSLVVILLHIQRTNKTGVLGKRTVPGTGPVVGGLSTCPGKKCRQSSRAH